MLGASLSNSLPTDDPHNASSHIAKYQSSQNSCLLNTDEAFRFPSKLRYSGAAWIGLMLVRSAFYLTKYTGMRNIEMRRQHTISEAAKELGITRNTLYKWIRAGSIPSPKETFISRIRLRVWNEEQMARIREYKKDNYWGKGIDRRTGKKVKEK